MRVLSQKWLKIPMNVAQRVFGLELARPHARAKVGTMHTDDQTIRTILETCKTIAVVGLSAEPERPSFGVARYLQAHGYRIVPVNPKYAQVLGEKSYASLRDIPFVIDIVDVFRKTSDVLPVAQDAVAIGAKCLWQQLGVENSEADALARAHGLASVMDRCVKIEHARLVG
jgi:predicted CoA-binding protein